MFSADKLSHYETQVKRGVQDPIDIDADEWYTECIEIGAYSSGEVDKMTVQQEAYQMIDRLSDDAVLALIHIMECMIPEKGKSKVEETPVESKKRDAYFRLKELRKELMSYDFSEDDRAEGLAMKFGTY